jgi:hypothetical protein
MKERFLKIGVPLLLVAILVVALMPAVALQAASKTTYNVTLLKGSATASVVSINDGTAAATGASLEGATFQLIVESKLKKETVKYGKTKVTAYYYPVKVPKKSYKEPTQQEYPMMTGEGTAVKYGFLNKDGKGKLYVSGGDVDYAAVTQGKKTKWAFGDGKEDPEGSLMLEIQAGSALSIKGSSKTLSKVIEKVCSIIVQKTKGGINEKALPDDVKSTKLVPDPFIGEVVDLDAGTGTVIGVAASMDATNKMVDGKVDNLTAHVWVLKISK